MQTMTHGHAWTHVPLLYQKVIDRQTNVQRVVPRSELSCVLCDVGGLVLHGADVNAHYS